MRRQAGRYASIGWMPLLVMVALQGFGPAAWGQSERLYIRPSQFDFTTLLGDPPAADSQEHQNEIATLLAWQNRRTAEQVLRCRREAEHLSVWLFADVLGDDFNSETHPLTEALFAEIHRNSEPVIFDAKRQFNRPRPYVEDPDIHPCVRLESSKSYPSGHAAAGVLWATILSNIFPEQREALMARGRLVGEDRVIAGIHWPTDVKAGQKLGAEMARRLLANRDFRYELESVRRECRGTVPDRARPAPAAAPATTEAPAAPAALDASPAPAWPAPAAPAQSGMP